MKTPAAGQARAIAARKRERIFRAVIWASRIGVTALMLLIVVSVDAAYTTSHRNDTRQEWQVRADELSLNLQGKILQNVQTVWGLAANVAVEPDINEARFNNLMSVIFELAPAVRNIGLAPGLVIRYVYPLRGNEAAIGLDLTSETLSAEQIQTLRNTHQATFTGPISLVQGGRGLAGRIPIFEQRSGRFWGVVSVILDLDKLYQKASLAELRRDFRFVLSSSTESSETDAVFYGPRETEWHDPVSSAIRMQGATWTIFAEPVNGWPSAPENPLLFRSLLLLMTVVVIGIVFWLTNLMLRERQIQARFRGLFELSPVGIALFSDRTKHLIRANPTFRQRFGKAGQSLDFFEEGFDSEGNPLLKATGAQKRLDSAARITDMQVYYPEPDGTMSPIRLQGLKLQHTGSEPMVWLITEDISERTKVEQMKSEFISTVSHELRTPLTSISGSLSLLANNAVGEMPDKFSKLLKIAHRNSQQLIFLVNDLLDIDKLAAGKMPFHMENTPLADRVRECVENISAVALERDIYVDVAPLPEDIVHADQLRLNQALNNLLSNAVKFSPERSTISVFTRHVEGAVRICVADQGEGIPLDFRERIFEKFAQADASTRRSRGGTGLGLPITRELMKRMNGSVGFKSPPGQGATFWLELPIIKPQ